MREDGVSLRERIRLNLIDAMRQAGINQVQLAEKLGISKGTVNNWTRGNNSPDVDMVPRICKVLNIPILDIYKPRDSEEAEYTGENPAYSSAALQLAQDYDQRLDRWGRETVRAVADVEIQRCEDEKNFRLEFLEKKPEPKVIPLFLSAPAAGIAAPIMGEDYVEYTLREGDPPAAMFAVKVSGDSMEPDFPDGAVVFCNKDPIQDGDIGVFAVDGGSVIKQYYYDKLMGMTYLFSLNRRRDDADVILSRSSGQTVTCLGRVITKRRYKLPGATF